jgi:hypothetical protein
MMEKCIACAVPFEAGDAYYDDVNGGGVHADCLGPERESYVGPDGEPLGPDDPIPAPSIWWPDPNDQSLGGALYDIARERYRQVKIEGWTPEHDDRHVDGELAKAAAVYAHGGPIANAIGRPTELGCMWPWSLSWFKPRARRDDLVRAAALIVAEIERLDRQAKVVAS